MFHKKFNKDLFSKNDHLLVAFSGGSDSVALLHYLIESSLSLKISAMYIHHGIRKRADEDVHFCRNFCQNYNIDFHVVHINIPTIAKSNKQSIEEAGRAQRYKLLVKKAIELDATKIVTAHHQDDQIETLLYRYLKGSTGLGIGINDALDTFSIKVIRPMMHVSKTEVLKYLNDHNLSFIVDESNSDNKYTRNLLRNELIPLIKDKINSNVTNTILRNQQIQDEIFDFINMYIKNNFFSIFHNEINISDIKKETLFIQKELIKRLILTQKTANNLIDINYESLNNILKFIHSNKPNSKYKLSEELFLVKEYDKLTIQKIEIYRNQDNTKNSEIYKLKLGLNDLPIGKFDLSITDDLQFSKNKNKISIDADKVNLDSLIIRTKNSGDSFRPLGMTGKQKIKDYFINKKIPESKRSDSFILEDAIQIIWLIGHEINDSVKITSKTTRVLRIKYDNYSE